MLHSTTHIGKISLAGRGLSMIDLRKCLLSVPNWFHMAISVNSKALVSTATAPLRHVRNRLLVFWKKTLHTVKILLDRSDGLGLIR